MFKGGFGYCSYCQSDLYSVFGKEISMKKVGDMKFIVNKKKFVCKICNEFLKGKNNKAKTLKRKPTREKDLFHEIWNEREKSSWISGKPLKKYEGTKFFYNMFIHVLSKKMFKKFRLKKDNIVLGTPYEHFLIDQGTEKMRKLYEDQNNVSFAPFYLLKEQLRNQYGK